MTSQLRACPGCGADNHGRSRYCGACGERLTGAETGAETAAEIRRQVTIVTSDLKGSTALGERLDPESLREVMTTYIDAMRGVFEGHGGTIEKIIGDAIVAVFGLPTPGEDDALRAVEASAESQRALVSLNARLEQRWGVQLTVRTGVATGEVLVGEASAGQHVLTGPAIGVATAMEQNAPPQEVLLAQSTRDAVGDAIGVEPMGSVIPKGSQAPVLTYRLVSVPEREVGAGPTGAAGARMCQTCGEESPEGFRYCGACGAAVGARTTLRDTRKTVSIVFADPKPRTADGTPPSPEALREVMPRYFARMQQALERHGATVEKFIGDAVMAVFGLPVRHEDDALRAVRAASDMQRALPELNAAFEVEYGLTLENHIGVNTGEVVAGDASLGQRLVTGDTVNVAARLEQAAGAREILIGDLTYRLVRAAVQVEAVEPLTLKGKSEPVPAYRLTAVTGVTEARQGVERRQDAPLVGRERELAALREAFGKANADRACRLATVIGDAGVGKSRLIREFIAAHADEALVIRGRCLPYGDGITFWPLREVVRDAAAIGDDDARAEALAKLRARIPDADVVERLASVIGLSDAPFPVPEIFWGARRFLEELAGARPVLLFIDDIHWAEATFLELIGNLVETVQSAPVLLLCSSRNELLERHPDWARETGSLRVVLEPLTDADAGRVVEALLGGTGIDAGVRGRIVDAAAGNPLFVEQLLSMLIDNGTLRRDGDRWSQVGDMATLAVPPTIQALVAARLDLLERGERGVIEPASVIGQNFAVAAVSELVVPEVAPALPALLASLTGKQLVQPNAGSLDDDATYRFHHVLVRDAAYGGLLKRDRAALHERFVDWAEPINVRQGRVTEFEEIQGYHLEQAYRYLVELGTVDDHARTLGERAAAKLASAGRRAFARGDMPAAVSLLRRASGTLPAGSLSQTQLQPDLGEALMELGEFEPAAQVLTDARAAAESLGDASLAAEAELIGLLVQQYTSEEDWSGRVMQAVERAIPIFEREGHHAGLALAARLQVGVHGTANRYGAAAVAAEQVIQHARAAGDARLERRGASGYAISALYGPIPVPEAIATIEEAADGVSGDRRTEGVLRSYLAQLYAMRGEFDLARSTYARARAMLEEVGGGLWAASSAAEYAQIELLAGDPAAAEAALRRDYDTLDALGEKFLLSTLAGILARAIFEQDRFAEAEELTHRVESLAGDDDPDAQALWRGVRARILANRGETEAALLLAGEAVVFRTQSEAPALRAEALADLAEVQRQAGIDAWRSSLAAALDEFDRKGDLVSAARLRGTYDAGRQRRPGGSG